MKEEEMEMLVICLRYEYFKNPELDVVATIMEIKKHLLRLRRV